MDEDWLKQEQEALERGEVCIHCGSAFGAVYGHASVTCASCGRPYRTKRMEQMDREHAQKRREG